MDMFCMSITIPSFCHLCVLLLINGFVTKVTFLVPLMEQELLTLTENMSASRF